MAADMSESGSEQGRVAAKVPENGGLCRTQAIGSAQSPSTEEIKRILQERALVLAQEETPETAVNDIQVVEFMLDGEHYAVESKYVDRIAFVENLTPVPCTPAFVSGVISLRGVIVPVFDSKKLFGMPHGNTTDFGNVIVLQSGEMRFGILADAIIGARHIASTDIQCWSATLSGVDKNYLKGVTSGHMAVLDAEKLLMDENLVVDEHIRE